MNRHHHLIASVQRSDFAGQVVQSIAVFREYDELFRTPVRRLHQFVVLKNCGEFIPFAILSAIPHLICHSFQFTERCNFGLKLRNCGRSRGLISHGLFLGFQLIRRQIVQIILIFRNIELPRKLHGAFAKLFFCQSGFHTFPTAMQ